MNNVAKRVKLRLEGLDGNAFYLLGAFYRAALDQGWSKEEALFVVNEAKRADYDHLLRTLIEHCEDD